MECQDVVKLWNSSIVVQKERCFTKLAGDLIVLWSIS